MEFGAIPIIRSFEILSNFGSFDVAPDRFPVSNSLIDLGGLRAFVGSDHEAKPSAMMTSGLTCALS